MGFLGVELVFKPQGECRHIVSTTAVVVEPETLMEFYGQAKRIMYSTLLTGFKETNMTLFYQYIIRLLAERNQRGSIFTLG